MYDFKEITIDDIDLEDDDCVTTEVTLLDYGWSTYRLKTQIKLVDKTYIIFEEEYTLTSIGTYVLKHINGDKIEEISFRTSSSFTLNHLREQLKAHLKYISSESAKLPMVELAISEYASVLKAYNMAKQDSPKKRTYKKKRNNIA